MQKLARLKNYLFYAILASMTLGLAPFRPEPHVWGKLRWVFGGAEGMKLADWGDLLMHGLPWLALIFFGIKAFVYFSSDEYKAAKTEYKAMLAAEDTSIIDVREPGEFKGGHFPGAINIPLSQIQGKVSDFENMKGTKVLYCRTGNRSGQAISFLKEKGIDGLQNGGGIKQMMRMK